MKEELEVKKVKGSNGEDLVSVNYESWFDKQGYERSVFTGLFNLQDYVKGLSDFREKGRASIKGMYGTIEMTPECLALISNLESINLLGRDNYRKELNVA